MQSQPSNHNAASQKQITRWTWVFVFTTSALLILFLPISPLASTPGDRHIRIEASMFQFAPAEVNINPGDRVTIELVSTDVVHGLSLDDYNFSITADPGQSATGTFVANKIGVFRFRCSVPCGNLHPFMIGKLHIGPDWLLARGIALGLLAVIAGMKSFSRNHGQ
jgi:heme/copper-type cytochrome/quinol oxidase subunit 2